MSLSNSVGSVNAIERAFSPESSDSGAGSGRGTGSEYSIPIRLYTPIITLPMPIAEPKRKAGLKRKAEDLDCTGDNDHQAKQQKSLAPVALVKGNIRLKNTWDLTELANRRELLPKFQVSPLSCRLMPILTLKGTHSFCYGKTSGAIGQLGRPIVEVQRQGQKDGELDLMYICFSHHFQVQNFLKEKPYEIDLSDHFLDVDAVMAIAFQIAIHNRRKHSKAIGEDLPPSKRRGAAKQSLLHQGDGAQGVSAAEILEKKQGELEARRKRRRDETVNAFLLFCCLC